MMSVWNKDVKQNSSFNIQLELLRFMNIQLSLIIGQKNDHVFQAEL